MNNIRGGGGTLYPELKDKGTIHILKPDEMDIRLQDIDFMKISNIGYINNRLHIQVKWIKDGIDDHGSFYFVDSLGNTDINENINSGSLSFGVDSLGNTVYGREYEEYIFDVSNINLSDIKLKGFFITAENFIKGKWKTKFKLQSKLEFIEKEKQCNVKLDMWKLHHISVSPLGITLIGSGETENLDKVLEGDYLQKIDFHVTMMDGSTQTFDSIDGWSDEKEISLKFSSLKLLDVSLIQSITINGTIIELHE